MCQFLLANFYFIPSNLPFTQRNKNILMIINGHMMYPLNQKSLMIMNQLFKLTNYNSIAWYFVSREKQLIGFEINRWHRMYFLCLCMWIWYICWLGYFSVSNVRNMYFYKRKFVFHKANIPNPHTQTQKIHSVSSINFKSD